MMSISDTRTRSMPMTRANGFIIAWHLIVSIMHIGMIVPGRRTKI